MGANLDCLATESESESIVKSVSPSPISSPKDKATPPVPLLSPWNNDPVPPTWDETDDGPHSLGSWNDEDKLSCFGDENDKDDSFLIISMPRRFTK